jgi:hypothetical protein
LVDFPSSPSVEANAAKALAESEALAEEQAMQEWKGGGRAESQIITRSPKSGNQQMANIGKVKFQPPNVPVIFVLGQLPSPPPPTPPTQISLSSSQVAPAAGRSRIVTR